MGEKGWLEQLVEALEDLFLHTWHDVAVGVVGDFQRGVAEHLGDPRAGAKGVLGELRDSVGPLTLFLG